jgi:homoserine dehydrogenase
VPDRHILASVSGVYNAIVVRGDLVGETLFYGRGAGQNPTSSAVISDLIDAAYNLARHAGCQGFIPQGFYGKAIPLEDTVSPYYLRLRVQDRPGVVAEVASVIARHGIGLSSLQQPSVEKGGEADLMLMMHAAPFGKMRDARRDLAQLDCVLNEPVLFRVENFEVA